MPLEWVHHNLEDLFCVNFKVIININISQSKYIIYVLFAMHQHVNGIILRIRKMSYDGPEGGYSFATEEYPGVFFINLFRPLEK